MRCAMKRFFTSALILAALAAPLAAQAAETPRFASASGTPWLNYTSTPPATLDGGV